MNASEEANKRKRETEEFLESIRKKNNLSTSGQVDKNLTKTWVFLHQVARSLVWIFDHFFVPVWRQVQRPALWLYYKYLDLWNRVVYKKDEYGVERFKVSRGAGMVVSSLLAGYIIIIFINITLVFTFWYIPFSYVDEEIYLYNSLKISDGVNPISSIDDVYEVHGCETLPCSDQTSVSFYVRATWFNELWAVLNHGSLYYPQFIAGAVAPIMQKCVITSYGFRKKLKVIVRQFDLYADLLEVKSCTPVNKGDSVIKNNDYR